MSIRFFHILGVMLLIAAVGNAQTLQADRPSKGKSSAKKKTVKLAPSYAWKVGEPLGLHYESTIDTLFEDYHKASVASMVSDAWATTGNLGAPGQDQIFFNRPHTGEFFFEDAIAPWLHSTLTQRYYNTRVPMTLLSHNTGGDKYSNQDRTQVEFSGNVNKRLAVGGGIDYVYSKGSYDLQSDKDFTWRLFGSYIGDRYELQTHLNHYNYTTLENGGITDDRFITDPAKVQGGETKVDNKSIPTRLDQAQSKLSGLQFYMNHRYKVGYYHYERDSVTDTVVSRTYVPVTSFIWTMDYRNAKHNFLNKNAVDDSTYFAHSYLGYGGTDETSRFWKLRNTLGVSLLEGFNRWAKLGFSVYATHEMRHYTQVADTSALWTGDVPLHELADSVPHSHTQHLVWVGGQLTKQRGSLLTYSATAQFGVAGDVAGEIDVTGDVGTRFPLLGDTVSLRGYGYFKNLAPNYLLNNFVSNHYAWHNSFDKQQRFRVGGELTLPLPYAWTRVNVGYETLNKYIYWGIDGTPAQHGDAIHVLSARLQENLAWKALHWDNTITLQTTSNDSILPLPKLAVYSNLYVKFTIARVLHTQLGVDANYYSSYLAPAYNPATMTFHTQRETECGDFLFMNLYANFKLKRARFYVMWSHFNQKFFGGKNYFASPHYPLNPARLLLGVSVDFAN